MFSFWHFFFYIKDAFTITYRHPLGSMSAMLELCSVRSVRLMIVYCCSRTSYCSHCFGLAQYNVLISSQLEKANSFTAHCCFIGLSAPIMSPQRRGESIIWWALHHTGLLSTFIPVVYLSTKQMYVPAASYRAAADNRRNACFASVKLPNQCTDLHDIQTDVLNMYSTATWEQFSVSDGCFPFTIHLESCCFQLCWSG